MSPNFQQEKKKKKRDRKSTHCLNTIDFQKKNTLCCLNIQGDDFVLKLDTYSITSHLLQ